MFVVAPCHDHAVVQPTRQLAVNGDVHVVDDVAPAFASHVIDAFDARPGFDFVMALSGGRTAARCYGTLAEASPGRVDWHAIDLFWSDERCVPMDSPDSNYRLGREALIDRVGAVRGVHPMQCTADDAGAQTYDALVGSLPRIDLIHLGLGVDGHTASLFPFSPALYADPDRLVVMNEDPLGNHPHRRMTMTYAGLARARLVIFTVETAAKREAFARILQGDMTLPAAVVQAGKVVWLVDPAAAGR